jgi:hypothetical protein
MDTAGGVWGRRLGFAVLLLLLVAGPPFLPPFLLTLLTQTLIRRRAVGVL